KLGKRLKNSLILYMIFNKEKIINFRKELHQNPELSDKEYLTAKKIVEFAEKFKPDNIISNIGGNGVVVIFSGKLPGVNVLFRADIDALPIQEANTFEYKSTNNNVSHKCGHDGHMAILMGLCEAISNNRPEKGSVILLFQPSEENGQGAHRVISDSVFKKEVNPDYSFGLHNLPGFEKKAIVIRENTFASASKGMIIKLKGRTSHAGEPENGNSPAIAMSDIIKELTLLPKENDFNDFVLTTVIHARLGDIAFGTTPGYAEVMATLRSYTNNDMDKLIRFAEKIVKDNCKKTKLNYDISYTEEFPATVNNSKALEYIKIAAKETNSKIKILEKPFRWSEDFAHYGRISKSTFFGLGSGLDCPQLHNSDYDFPDDIIETGVNMFYNVYTQLIKIN
ncbi:MAG: amidohydrolase, partial [Bacteroidota bacterium]|nr:amidohydrolase [Bacteroidota bacterium]